MKTFLILFLLLISKTVFSQLPPEIINFKGNTANIVTIETNIELILLKYWDENTHKMNNPFRETVPKRIIDVFGINFSRQIKFHPYKNPYVISNIPDDFIEWVYIQLIDTTTNTFFYIPGWLNKDGVIKDALDASKNVLLQVIPNKTYRLKVHTSTFSVYSSKIFYIQNSRNNRISINFKLGDSEIVPNELGLPSIMMPLIGVTNVYGIKYGDTYQTAEIIFSEKIDPSADNFADLADMAAINNDLNFITSNDNKWYVTDMNNDGKVKWNDYWAVWDENIFLTLSAAGTIQ